MQYHNHIQVAERSNTDKEEIKPCTLCCFRDLSICRGYHNVLGELSSFPPPTSNSVIPSEHMTKLPAVHIRHAIRGMATDLEMRRNGLGAQSLHWPRG
jgi:hypothetical protein